MRTHFDRLVLAATVLAWTAASVAAQSTLYVLPGDQGGDELGTIARSAGDVDGDGAADVLASSVLGAGGAGYLRVSSGECGLTLLEVAGAAPGDEFGASAASLGDVDGDGRADLLVGAPGAGGTGRAYVVSGASGAFLCTFSGSGAGDRFGAAVASLGDVDGDGLGDFAIGAPGDDDAGSDSGSVFVLSGASGATLRQHVGAAGGHLCGHALAALADLDGDGVRELAVGEPYAAVANTNQSGRVRVFSGASGALRFVRPGPAARDRFGFALDDAGDVDGDGLRDVLVGAPQPKPNAAGYAAVLSGANGATLLQVLGDAPGDQFGGAVAGAGDVDGDGRGDVWIGAPLADFAGTDSGRVRLVSGAGGATLASFDGASAGCRLGGALGGAFDANADEVPDAVFASGGASSAGPASGEVRVVSTRALALSTGSHVLSLAAPAPFTLAFDAGAAHAGERYVVLGSIDGALPGCSLGGLPLPLNPGRYLDYSLRFVTGGVLVHQRGQLDAAGCAAPRFDPWRSPSSAELVGRTFHHVVLLLDAAGVPTFVSNAAPVTLTP